MSNESEFISDLMLSSKPEIEVTGLPLYSLGITISIPSKTVLPIPTSYASPLLIGVNLKTSCFSSTSILTTFAIYAWWKFIC